MAEKANEALIRAAEDGSVAGVKAALKAGFFTQSHHDVVCDNDLCTTVTWRQGPLSLNLKTPPRKDTNLLPAHVYAVVRSDNPGFWFLHCHQSMHLSEGMAMVLNVAEDRHPAPPSGFPTCGNFDWSEEEYEAAMSGKWSQQEVPARHETWELVVAAVGSAAAGATAAVELMLLRGRFATPKAKGFQGTTEK